MTKDPYEDGPSQEELEASGAIGWFDDSIAEQKKRNAGLRSELGKDRGSIKAQKDKLRGLLELPPDLNPEEPAPDLFASERAAGKKETSALSGLMGDFQKSRAEEKSMLKDLFGK